MLANGEYAIQAPDFFDLYGKENVMIDMLRVKQKQMSFEKQQTPESNETKRASEVFEAIVLEQAELSNWLGDNVSVLKTSIYDDYFNGTDMVAEWSDPERESNVLALAVDVTFGAGSVERKLQHVRRDVDSGKLGKIKYFKSADGSFRGERNGVPHVVIGVSRHAVEHLADLWLKKDKRALGTHPIQRAMIEEVYQQLQMIQGHALSRGQTKVAEAYGRSFAIVEKIRSQKSDVPLGELEHDKVYGEILSQSRTIFQS